ncbi:MAG TPA: barstar family protein [Rhodocyclaceae bacterium]|nr:barstar family protein [Rhodocyclaceae bacterium]
MLGARLADAAAAGVYRLPPDLAPTVERASRAQRYGLIEASFSGLTGKRALLEELARAFALPEWFGYNWDALSDCLTDLSWKEAPGYVLRIAHAERWLREEPDDWRVLCDALRDVSDYWRHEAVPFWTLFELAEPVPGLAELVVR